MYQIPSVYPQTVSPPKRPATAPAAKPKKEAVKPEPTAPKENASLVSKLNMVVGKVLSVRKHPDADSLYIETIDVGEVEPRQVVSGLVKFMTPEEINGKTILVLKNLKPVPMRGVKSFAMVMCASDAEHTKVEFLIPPEGSLPGDKVYFEGHEGEPEEQLNPKKKVFETIQPDFSTREDLVATWKGIPFRTKKGLVKAASLINANIK
ncbi:G4 quadruplex nucleic acid binding protein [Kappamyces sp. JEL0680]|nr:G4 quadruplex nucleic acid binding protein [Kappamyces sp. JEL0680]